MRPPSGDFENPGSGSTHPVLARNRLLEEILYQHVDAGVAFRGIDLGFTD